MSTNLVEFLAMYGAKQIYHFGVKGQKWGVRRDKGQLGNTQGGTESGSKSSSADVHVSADAMRFIQTRQKAGHEMSDREIRETLNRAKMVNEYDAMFRPDSNAALRSKVETLNLQKQYGQLDAELNPSLVSKLVSASAAGYSSYVKLNDATGGELNDLIADALGMKSPGGKHRAPGGFKLPKPKK